MSPAASRKKWHLPGLYKKAGDLKTIEELVSALGVARIGDSAGEFEHTLVRFLVDGKGRIRNRLLGAKYNPEEISRTIRRGVASFGQK